MIEAAIFDFDGTLFDSMYIWELIGEDFLKSINIKARPDLKEKLKPLSLYQAADYCKKEYDIRLSIEEIIKGFNSIAADYYINIIKPKPYVKDFLESLLENNISLCIATAADKALIKSALRRCDMEKYFAFILDCEDIPKGKSVPDIYLKALKSLKTRQDKTLVFEDAAHAVRVAKSGGFRVAAVYDKFEKDKSMIKKADIYLKNYIDIDEFWKFASQI